MPLTEIANKIGDIKTANMAAIGAFIATTPLVKIDNVKKVIMEVFKTKKAQLLIKNIKALQEGYEFIKAKAIKNFGLIQKLLV